MKHHLSYANTETWQQFIWYPNRQQHQNKIPLFFLSLVASYQQVGTKNILRLNVFL